MASSGTLNSTGYEGRFVQFTWSTVSQSIANNTSTISWTLKGAGNAQSGWYKSGAFKVVIDGSVEFTKSDRIQLYNGTTIASGTKVISHNGDGSRSFGVSIEAAIYSYAVNCSGSTTFTLNTIPRASSFGSISGNTIGSNITVNINRHSNSFTHQLWYRLGQSQWYDCGSGIGTSKTITPTLELCRQIPNSTGGTLELCIRTFNGSAQIGSDVYKSIYVNVPSHIRPSAPSITLTRIDNGVPSSFGVYVQGYSKVKATASSSGSYGSTIQSYSISCEGVSGGNGSTFGSFNNGTKTITATATDSRGRTTSNSVTFTVYPYVNPSITLTGVRCNSDGVINTAGTNIKVTCSWNIASVNGKNGVASRKVSISPGTATNTTFTSGVSFVLIANLNIASTGKLTATITDTMGNSQTVTYDIPTDVRVMNVKENKKGIAFGGFATEDNVAKFDWRIQANKDLAVEGYASCNKVFRAGKYINQSTLVDGGYRIHDIREVNPVPRMFGNYTMNMYFSLNGTPGNDWRSILHLRGWSEDNHFSHELAFNAAFNYENHLYHRIGRPLDGWRPWERLVNASETPTVSTGNGWACFEFPNGLKIQTYQATLSIAYNTWLAGQTAFCYLPNFPNFAKTFSYVPTVTCQCRQLTTEDCYMTLIVPPSTTNVGYRDNGKCGYINTSTQALKGTTQKFVISFIAIGR